MSWNGTLKPAPLVAVLVSFVFVLSAQERKQPAPAPTNLKVLKATTGAEVMQITDIFRAKIVDVQPKSLTIEITGDGSKIEKFLTLMKTFGVTDLTRTGSVAMPRK